MARREEGAYSPYVTDEQRSQPRWIGREGERVIHSRALSRAGMVVALVGAAACGALPRGGQAGGEADARIVLYRDSALVDEEIVVELARGRQRVTVPVARGLGDGDLIVVSDDAVIHGWTVEGERARGAVIEARTGPRVVAGRLGDVSDEAVVVEAADGLHVMPTPEVIVGGRAAAVVVDLEARRAGRGRLRLRYLTDRLTWRASYTLIADGARGRIHGGLAFDNRTGRSWQRARLAVIDRDRPAAAPTAGALVDRAVAVPGVFAVRPGPQRLDLALRDRGLGLVPTLVYDPVGVALDSARMRPQVDEDYGVQRWPDAVDESLKIDLSRATDGPLPAGPIRVFTVGADGALVWRGEGRLLPPAADAERYTTVAVGRSPDVTGRRKRTDFFLDETARRLIEEYTVTLTNRGIRPVEVLAREHLYRGQCWTLAYHSTGERVAKEGAQQIGLGVVVAAGGEAVVMYRVLYEWDESKCQASTSKR